MQIERPGAQRYGQRSRANPQRKVPVQGSDPTGINAHEPHGIYIQSLVDTENNPSGGIRLGEKEVIEWFSNEGTERRESPRIDRVDDLVPLW